MKICTVSMWITMFVFFFKSDPNGCIATTGVLNWKTIVSADQVLDQLFPHLGHDPMCLMRVPLLQLNFQQELDPSTKYFPEEDYGNVKYQWQITAWGC